MGQAMGDPSQPHATDTTGDHFLCPRCGKASLEETFSLELPPNDTDDETSLQTVKCGNCGFSGIAVYRENRRGRLDSEKWDYSGYEVSEGSLKPLLEALSQCPAPGDRRCQCPTHLALGGKKSWNNPSECGLDVQKWFAMRPSR
jgi:ribosomal protein L37E